MRAKVWLKKYKIIRALPYCYPGHWFTAETAAEAARPKIQKPKPDLNLKHRNAKTINPEALNLNPSQTLNPNPKPPNPKPQNPKTLKP